MDAKLSIITPCYNDAEKLESTLASLRGELLSHDELLIVDSSTDRAIVPAVISRAFLQCAVRYFWVKPDGVYGAQNHGIREASGEWIQVVNAGDRLCQGARQAIGIAVEAFPNIALHVFRQRAIGDGVPPYVFIPTAVSIWPHQSIVVNRVVYMEFGVYPEEHRLCAEQIYFAKVRRSQPWRLHAVVLTEYLQGGLSTSVSFAHLKDVFRGRRLLGQGNMRSFFGAFVLPVVRRLLEKTIGQTATIRLKRRLFSYYSAED